MRVALDATPLTISSGGIARYTSELSAALAENYPEDEFILLSDQPFAMPKSLYPNLRRGGTPRNRWEQRWWLWGVDRELNRLQADIFHGPEFSVPYLPRRPSVLSLHDLSPWMESRWHHAAERVRARAPYLIGLRIATMILTDSEAVRRQAIGQFRVHPHRIVAVPLAASERFRPERLPRPSGIPYFLYVGTLEPRKNLELVFEAWRSVRREHAVDLVLAGRHRPDFPELAPEPGLRVLGEVSDEELPSLYSNALAFLYPSWYEGFGLPVLEAMRCGAAVLTSTDPAIGEVAGDAAVKLDARDKRVWIEAMRAAIALPAWIETLREKARRRSQEYSWARTARLTRAVYQEAQQRGADL